MKTVEADESLTSRKNLLLIVSLNLILFSVFILVSVLAPFIPVKIQELGYSDFYSGVIMAMYPFVVLCLSVFWGYLIQFIGCVKVLFGGVCTLMVATICFGIFSDNLVVLMILRAVQGFGGSAAASATFAVVAIRFEKRKATVIGIVETVSGLGYLVGPVFGGVFYSIGGFRLPFLAFGGFFLAILPFLFLATRGDLKEVDAHFTRHEDESPHFKDLMNKTMVITCGFVVMTDMAINSFTPTLALFLIGDFHVSESQSAYMFAIGPVAYAVMCSFVGRMTEKIGSKKVMLTGAIVMGVAFLLLGPVPALHNLIDGHETTKWVILIVALATTAGGTAISFVPLLPTMIDSVAGLNAEGVVAGLFSSLCAAGMVIGPLIGSYLTSSINFQSANMIVGIMMFCYAPLLLIIKGTKPVKLLHNEAGFEALNKVDFDELEVSNELQSKRKLLSNK